jgi:cell wall-associated NlpC family hydrolase
MILPMIHIITVLTSVLTFASDPIVPVIVPLQLGTDVLYDESVNRTGANPIDTVDLISYAQSLKGIPYKYASADPDKGFDCSGFVLYVFKHFNINVPRSSSAFSKIGTVVPLREAKAGDIILFTRTNSSVRSVGHVGIVTNGGPAISFIHATSGKAYSVVETAMTPHYKKRFVKVVRVLK